MQIIDNNREILDQILSISGDERVSVTHGDPQEVLRLKYRIAAVLRKLPIIPDDSPYAPYKKLHKNLTVHYSANRDPNLIEFSLKTPISLSGEKKKPLPSWFRSFSNINSKDRLLHISLSQTATLRVPVGLNANPSIIRETLLYHAERLPFRLSDETSITLDYTEDNEDVFSIHPVVG